MNVPTKIVRRPECLEKPVNPELSNKWTIDVEYRQLFEWSNHLESRLAKYETHHPDPKPGEASIVKHTAYDPDRRPEIMILVDANEEFSPDDTDWNGLLNHFLATASWANHLESVREGLQRQLNHFERMYQQDHDPKRRDPKSAN